MENNIGTADFCLKFDHRKHKLYIYINKFQITSQNANIEKVSLSFELLPSNNTLISQKKSRSQNDIYFMFFESLVFKKIEPEKIGKMGLVVKVFSHLNFYSKIKLGDNYQPLDNLDLTSKLSRVILPLNSDDVSYKKEYSDQNLRIEMRRTSAIKSCEYSSKDPMVAIALKFHPNVSRLDVYIQRLTRINLYVNHGYVSVGFMTCGSRLVSVNKSGDLHFSHDNLIHESIPLDTKDVNLKEGGIFIQICPKKKNDIQIQSMDFKKDFGVVYAMFGLEEYSALPAKLIWEDLLNDRIDNKNRWHILKVGGINVG